MTDSWFKSSHPLIAIMGCRISRVSPGACALFTSLTRLQLFPIAGYIACEVSKSVFISTDTDIPDVLEQICGVFSTLISLASLYVLFKDKFQDGQLMAPPTPDPESPPTSKPEMGISKAWRPVPVHYNSVDSLTEEFKMMDVDVE